MIHLSRRALMITMLTAALAACGGGGGDDDDPAQTESIDVTLNSSQEVADAEVASGALGSATLILDRASGALSGKLEVDGMTATAAHIHTGVAGENGAVLIELEAAGDGSFDVPAGTTLDSDQLASLDAGGLYLNAHSDAFPDGEMRGQIGTEVLASHMSGSQESALVESAATGVGRVALDAKTGALTGGFVVQDIVVTDAHIHQGAFGVDGPVIVELEGQGNGLWTVPANTVVDADFQAALKAGELYFNAHSAEHPTGEIRGQIGRSQRFAALSGANEVPANNSVGSGRAAVSLDPVTRELAGSVTLEGFDVTAAHLHAGAAGSNGPVVVELVRTAPGVWSVPAATVLEADQVRLLLSDGLYANAHSVAYPDGEVRGQLDLR
jgi:CHRD domain